MYWVSLHRSRTIVSRNSFPMFLAAPGNLGQNLFHGANRLNLRLGAQGCELSLAPHHLSTMGLRWMIDAESLGWGVSNRKRQGVLQITSHRPQICIACAPTTRSWRSILRWRKMEITGFPTPLWPWLPHQAVIAWLLPPPRLLATLHGLSLSECSVTDPLDELSITILVINVLKGIIGSNEFWIIQFQSNQAMPYISILVAMPGAYSFWSISKHTLALEAYEEVPCTAL